MLTTGGGGAPWWYESVGKVNENPHKDIIMTAPSKNYAKNINNTNPFMMIQRISQNFLTKNYISRRFADKWCSTGQNKNDKITNLCWVVLETTLFNYLFNHKIYILSKTIWARWFLFFAWFFVIQIRCSISFWELCFEFSWKKRLYHGYIYETQKYAKQRVSYLVI